MKCLRKQIYPSSGNIICDLTCSLIGHIVVCYPACACMCMYCVTSRWQDWNLHHPYFVEVEKPSPCHMLTLGYYPLWLIEECKISNRGPPSSSLRPTPEQRWQRWNLRLDPWKLEWENAHPFIWFSPRNLVGVHFPCVVVFTSFLSGVVFWLVLLINTLMELLMFHLTVCLEITFCKYFFSR